MPAVAANVAVVAPLAIVTVPGTVSVARVLDSVTVAPPAFAALDKVTVQEAVPPVPRLAGAQESWLNTPGAVSDTDAVCELLL